MAIIKNIFIKDILNIVFFLKIFMFLLLTWIFTFFNDICFTYESMKDDHTLHGTYGIGIHRLLSKIELEIGLEPKNIEEEIPHNYEINELDNASDDKSIYRNLNKNSSNHMYSYRKNFKNTYAKKKGLEKLDFYCEKKKNIEEEIPHNYEINELDNASDDKSIYRNLNKNSSNHMYSYRKNFKNTYAKKKGLEKLDFYCEKKIFNNIDKIYKLAENRNYDKKSFKNIIVKKYGYKIIFFTLFSLLGLIVPILVWAEVKVLPDSLKCVIHKLIPDINYAFFTIYCTIFILTILYIFIKIVKYEKLKAGKGKMNRKEYICFCKEIFNIN
ncbi:Protein of unknown function, putative [Plasmodium vivax]|uniref:Variable surface protein Vir35 n=1 Tax=Plasmodium vivax TaxID=5855 RepID=A0A1G4E850_PLAVI|nr:Protein of unknown function, putative [Plasmodium vivax]